MLDAESSLDLPPLRLSHVGPETKRLPGYCVFSTLLDYRTTSTQRTESSDDVVALDLVDIEQLSVRAPAYCSVVPTEIDQVGAALSGRGSPRSLSSIDNVSNHDTYDQCKSSTDTPVHVDETASWRQRHAEHQDSNAQHDADVSPSFSIRHRSTLLFHELDTIECVRNLAIYDALCVRYDFRLRMAHQRTQPVAQRVVVVLTP